VCIEKYTHRKVKDTTLCGHKGKRSSFYKHKCHFYSNICLWSKFELDYEKCARGTGSFNPLNPELNPICCLLALLEAHHFLHVSRIRVKLLTFRRLMSYIYMEHPFLMFLDHTQRRSTVGRTPLDE